MVSGRSSRKHCDRSGWSSWFCAVFEGGSRLATRAPVVVSTGSAYARRCPASATATPSTYTPLYFPPPPLPPFSLSLSVFLPVYPCPRFPSENLTTLDDDQRSVGLLRGLHNFWRDLMTAEWISFPRTKFS